MATQLQKTYDCLTCKAQIKLSKKDSGNGWDKWNLDGSPHMHPSKTQQQQPHPEATPPPTQQRREIPETSFVERRVIPQPQPQQLSDAPQIAALAQEIAELRAEVKILIAQIQGLRSELKLKKNERQ